MTQKVRFGLTLPNRRALEGATTINEMLDLPEMADSSGMFRRLVRRIDSGKAQIGSTDNIGHGLLRQCASSMNGILPTEYRLWVAFCPGLAKQLRKRWLPGKGVPPQRGVQSIVAQLEGLPG